MDRVGKAGVLKRLGATVLAVMMLGGVGLAHARGFASHETYRRQVAAELQVAARALATTVGDVAHSPTAAKKVARHFEVATVTVDVELVSYPYDRALQTAGAKLQAEGGQVYENPSRAAHVTPEFRKLRAEINHRVAIDTESDGAS